MKIENLWMIWEFNKIRFVFCNTFIKVFLHFIKVLFVQMCRNKQTRVYSVVKKKYLLLKEVFLGLQKCKRLNIGTNEKFYRFYLGT